MKKNSIYLLLITVLFLVFGSLGVDAKKRTLKIYVVPSDAQISVDGNYIGDGLVEVTLDKTDFIAIKLEKDGYLTQENKFYKSDKSRGLDKTGVGLGLYLVKSMIEAHGEKIWVESEAGKWCRFAFTLHKKKV